jgi:hypothetical protein
MKPTTKRTPLQAIRAKCLDCSNRLKSEVTECPIKDCPLWPMREGKDPWAQTETKKRSKK